MDRLILFFFCRIYQLNDLKIYTKIFHYIKGNFSLYNKSKNYKCFLKVKEFLIWFLFGSLLKFSTVLVKVYKKVR